jgi:hypothetical protein
VSTGTHSGSRTNRTDKFFPIGCPLVRTRRFSWRARAALVRFCPPLSASGCRGISSRSGPSSAPAPIRPSRPAGIRKANRSCADSAAPRARHRKTSTLSRTLAWQLERGSNPWLSHDHAFAIKSTDLRAAEFRRSVEARVTAIPLHRPGSSPPADARRHGDRLRTRRDCGRHGTGPARATLGDRDRACMEARFAPTY